MHTSYVFYFKHAGDRTNVSSTDLSDILPEEIEAEVKLAAEISMGTEVSEEDIANIMHLCDQVCWRKIISSNHCYLPSLVVYSRCLCLPVGD